MLKIFNSPNSTSFVSYKKDCMLNYILKIFNSPNSTSFESYAKDCMLSMVFNSYLVVASLSMAIKCRNMSG